ncbi:hypothetical protein [Actinomadura meyerae]|uniref:hypothetical protein n=1 Tax=Actinomadura meyerae TaxID=240840 RepID=UPI001178AA88|nr:hypothetical protein [Actinomadura meyerae]
MDRRHIVRSIAERRRRTQATEPPPRTRLFSSPIFVSTVVALLVAWFTPLPRVVKDFFLPLKGIEVSVIDLNKRFEALSISMCGWNYVDQQVPSNFHPDDKTKTIEFAKWVTRHQLTVGRSSVQVVLSTSTKPISLIDLDVEIVSRSRNLQGGASFFIDCPDYHGLPSIRPSYYLTADLDYAPPLLLAKDTPKDLYQTRRPMKPMEFPLEIHAEELQHLYIAAQTYYCDCTWRATLTWTQGGKVSRTIIGDKKKPFRVVGEELPIPQLKYSPKTKRWSLCHDGPKCPDLRFNKHGGLETKT